MNVNLLSFLAFHQEDGRAAAGCEGGRGVDVCVRWGGGRGRFGIRGGGKVAGLGTTGPEGVEASASLVMVMRRVRSGRRMSFSPPWQRHRVPPREGSGVRPTRSLDPPSHTVLLFYFHRGCATQRVPKRNPVTEKNR